MRLNMLLLLPPLLLNTASAAIAGNDRDVTGDEEYSEDDDYQGYDDGYEEDDYDGEETWHEHRWRPKEGYRRDGEVNQHQYHKLTHHLYQAESATEDLMTKIQA